MATEKESTIGELIAAWSLDSDSSPIDNLAMAVWDAAIEAAAKIAAKHKESIDCSVDSSNGRQGQIIEFDGLQIAHEIRKLKGEPS